MLWIEVGIKAVCARPQETCQAMPATILPNCLGQKQRRGLDLVVAMPLGWGLRNGSSKTLDDL